MAEGDTKPINPVVIEAHNVDTFREWTLEPSHELIRWWWWWLLTACRASKADVCE